MQSILNKIHLPEIFRFKIVEVANELITNSSQLDMRELWLIGSAARGDVKATSDIDLLVLTDNDNVPHISYLVESLHIRNDISYPNVDVIVRNDKLLSDSVNFRFNDFVKHDRIILWKRD